MTSQIGNRLLNIDKTLENDGKIEMQSFNFALIIGEEVVLNFFLRWVMGWRKLLLENDNKIFAEKNKHMFIETSGWKNTLKVVWLKIEIILQNAFMFH